MSGKISFGDLQGDFSNFVNWIDDRIDKVRAGQDDKEDDGSADNTSSRNQDVNLPLDRSEGYNISQSGEVGVIDSRCKQGIAQDAFTVDGVIRGGVPGWACQSSNIVRHLRIRRRGKTTGSDDDSSTFINCHQFHQVFVLKVFYHLSGSN